MFTRETTKLSLDFVLLAFATDPRRKQDASLCYFCGETVCDRKSLPPQNQNHKPEHNRIWLRYALLSEP